MNRKNNRNTDRDRVKTIRRQDERLNAEGFLFPSRVASTLVVLVVIGLAYVWLHNSSEALGRKIRKLELEEQELDRRIDIEKYNWASLTSPANLHEALRKHGLSMSVPAPANVVVIDRVDEWLDRGRKADVPFLQVAGAEGNTPR